MASRSPASIVDENTVLLSQSSAESRYGTQDQFHGDQLQGDQLNGDQLNGDQNKKCSRASFWPFYILCLLTGQLVIKPDRQEINAAEENNAPGDDPADHREEPNRHKLVAVQVTKFMVIVSSIIFMLIGCAVNLFSFGFDLYVVGKCPYPNCSYIDVPVYAELSNISGNISVNDTSFGIPQPEKIAKYDDWQKTVFTTASLSGMVSYLYIIYVLYSHYSIFACGRRRQVNALKLTPFSDSEETTRLSPNQCVCFYAIFILNLNVFISQVTVFFTLFSQKIDTIDKMNEIIDTFGLVTQFSSQFCAILSCFIFSKVAYAISNHCYFDLIKHFNAVGNKRLGPDRGELQEFLRTLKNNKKCLTSSTNDELERTFDRPNLHLRILKGVDKHYTEMVKSSLGPYGTWFALHWILYTLTTFLAIASVAETIIEELYSTEPAFNKCHAEKHASCRLTLAYIMLFTLQHCILFIYPCYRAATVTYARKRLITKVSAAEWQQVPLDEKQAFIQYLKDQDCTFKVSILCARLTFGFNIAYFSIIAGILGVVLKLSI